MGTDWSRFPKVNVERAGSPSHDLPPRYVSFLREEHIFILDFGHNVRTPLNLFVMHISPSIVSFT
jgi:hypothetical protein